MSKEIVQIINQDTFKSVDEEERLFTAVVLRPEVVDAHGDIYSESVVKQACHDFNRLVLSNGGTNVQHAVDVDKSAIEFVESFISPCDIEYANGKALKGDWVATAKIHNDKIWDACKSGQFTGFSVGCTAKLEVLDGS